MALGGRIPLIGRPHVGGQDLADVRQAFEQFEADAPAPLDAVAARQIMAQALVADRVGDLLAEPVVELGGGLTQCVAVIEGSSFSRLKYPGKSSSRSRAMISTT